MVAEVVVRSLKLKVERARKTFLLLRGKAALHKKLSF